MMITLTTPVGFRIKPTAQEIQESLTMTETKQCNYIVPNSRRPRRRRVAMNLAALVAAIWSNPHPVNAFQTKSSMRQNVGQTDTVLFFRTGGLDGVETLTASPVLPSSLLQQAPSPYTTRSHMPAWLAMPKSHMSEYNLEKLQAALRDSYFTENEALKLLFAIQEAAGNDRHKIAGAAEFCLMLVETMELGINALVAAAFHFCSCVTAREQRSSVLSERFHMSSFGDEVVRIARDAARLKELEMVAARVVEQKRQHGQQDADNLRMLLLSESKDWRALAIRSAACLFRLRGLLDSPQDLEELNPEHVRVAREALWIYAPTASRLGMHRLKNELEGAAFQVLFKEQYERINSLTKERETPNGPTVQESMNNVLAHVQKAVTEMLEKDEQFSSLVGDFTVTARVKEPYSMWRKMMSHGYQHIYQVPDALALRIVLNAAPITDDEPIETIRTREKALCYYAQKLCTERFQPQPHDPRFKDYIGKPKTNGYQSLHYTAKISHGNKDWSMEIQVRSGEMHQVAEFGFASHWDYKAQSGSTASPGSDGNIYSSKQYLRQVQQWHWEQQGGASVSKSTSKTAVEVDPWLKAEELDDLWQSRVRAERIRARTRLQPYIEALTLAQSDLTRDYVFVFYEPEGSVLSLPAGACVVDALRKGQRGASLFGITNLNGRQTAATKRLRNGDVLTVQQLPVRL